MTYWATQLHECRRIPIRRLRRYFPLYGKFRYPLYIKYSQHLDNSAHGALQLF